jgi:RecQ-mediated genome instability protein 1
VSPSALDVVFELAFAHERHSLTETAPNQTPQQLIKAVEQQLLMSDLHDSVQPPGPLDRLRAATDDLYDLSSTRGVLVQVTSLTDIGHSAITLRDAHSKRKEERAGGPAVVGNVEDDAAAGGPTRFPRGMLAFDLSDGHTSLRSIEYERLPAVNLGEIPLGAKFVLKACRVRRGVALLTPLTAIYKGHQVQELEETADAVFEADLQARVEYVARARRALTRSSVSSGQNAAPAAAPQPRAPARKAAPALRQAPALRAAVPRPTPAPIIPRAAPAPRPAPAIDLDEDDDFDMDDADLLAAAEQAEQAVFADRRAQQRAPQLDVASADDDDDAMWAGMGDDEMVPELWPEENEPPPSPPPPPIGRGTRKAPASVISLSSDM